MLRVPALRRRCAAPRCAALCLLPASATPSPPAALSHSRHARTPPADKGKYDYISTFALSSELGGFNRLCTAPKGVQGYYAQCMTAACFKRPAWDGSPITCYCPVYKSIKYLVGSPDTANSTCKPMLVSVGRRVGRAGGRSSPAPPLALHGWMLAADGCCKRPRHGPTAALA